jgi:hypothetical protein
MGWFEIAIAQIAYEILITPPIDWRQGSCATGPCRNTPSALLPLSYPCNATSAFACLLHRRKHQHRGSSHAARVCTPPSATPLNVHSLSHTQHFPLLSNYSGWQAESHLAHGSVHALAHGALGLVPMARMVSQRCMSFLCAVARWLPSCKIDCIRLLVQS